MKKYKGKEGFDEIKEDYQNLKTIREKISNLNPDFFNKVLVENPQFVVYYDAWENDDEVDPILSLIFRIQESINEDFSIKIDLPEIINKFLEIVGKFEKFKTFKTLTEVANLIYLSFKDPTSVVKFNSEFEDQKQNAKLKDQIRDFLGSILNGRGEKLIILIDELDRCSPNYAVKMLERIKHYFDDDRIIFVFSTDLSQLTHTIKKYYGEGYDSYKYLNRFLDFRFQLSEVNIERYCNNINLYKVNSFNDNICKVIIKMYNLSLRQINKFYRLIKISLPKEIVGDVFYSHYSENENFSRDFCIIFIIPLAIALSILDNVKYKDFINGRDSSPLEELAYKYNEVFGKYIERLFLPDFIEEENSEINSVYELNKKIKQVYYAIFVEKYDDYICVGDIILNYYIKKSIYNFLDLLSSLSHFGE